MAFEKHIFELSIYNEEVRILVQNGESHPQLDDGWAEQRYVEIKAENEEKLKAEIRRRFPESKGYVCTSILNLSDY